jgi:hypothetical protein
MNRVSSVWKIFRFQIGSEVDLYIQSLYIARKIITAENSRMSMNQNGGKNKIKKPK